MLHMKFGYIWPSGFREESRLKVWTDDGSFPFYKLPRSLRLRGAKTRKLRWFAHVLRPSGLTKTILQRTLKGKKKKR